MRDAAAAGQNVKVSGNRHSISDAICTSGVIIKSSQAAIYSTGTFEGEDTVLVDAGVKLGDLTEWLHARGKSLGYALMGFRLPTIAGAVATGSHGSSPKNDAVLASRVRWIELVDSAGNLRTFSRGTTPAAQWRALTANAGMLGMVTRLRLAIEPQFNLRVQVSFHDEAALVPERRAARAGGELRLRPDQLVPAHEEVHADVRHRDDRRRRRPAPRTCC